jgi:hypothetical protein
MLVAQAATLRNLVSVAGVRAVEHISFNTPSCIFENMVEISIH